MLVTDKDRIEAANEMSLIGNLDAIGSWYLIAKKCRIPEPLCLEDRQITSSLVYQFCRSPDSC
jgi:hypothetical protein